MKCPNIAAVLVIGLASHIASAQTPVPSAPATPAPPAADAPPPAAPAISKPTVAEGSLFKTQRQKNDKGKFEWVCTYSVEGLKRSVLLDESCPASMVFALKR